MAVVEVVEVDDDVELVLLVEEKEVDVEEKEDDRDDSGTALFPEMEPDEMEDTDGRLTGVGAAGGKKPSAVPPPPAARSEPSTSMSVREGGRSGGDWLICGARRGDGDGDRERIEAAGLAEGRGGAVEAEGRTRGLLPAPAAAAPPAAAGACSGSLGPAAWTGRYGWLLR